MSFTPIFSSPCDLARRMPDMIAGFLQLDIAQGKRFREESVTDALVASLLQLNQKDVVVVVPIEQQTGADLDILVVDESTQYAVRFRLQAKRLTANLKKWEHSAYRELCHPNNTGRQASTLLRSSSHESIKTIPLYIFYNQQWVCEQSRNKVSGVELADAYEVSRVIKTIVAHKPKRLPLKRIQALAHLFFPLSTILCANSGNTDRRHSIPPPDAAKSAVENAIAERLPSLPMAELPMPRVALELPDDELPEDFEHQADISPKRHRLPKVIQDAISKRGEVRIHKGRVRRQTVILVSGES